MHEQELRAVSWLTPKEGEHLFDRETPEGVWKVLDLNRLLARVYVSPASPDWFRELVEKTTKRYGFDKTILQSDMNAQPMF